MKDYKNELKVGITPAYAGKTAEFEDGGRWYRDHPRLRGKDWVMASSMMNGIGSPPLTRERQAVAAMLDLHTGITPAYAGKTHVYCFFF